MFILDINTLQLDVMVQSQEKIDNTCIFQKLLFLLFFLEYPLGLEPENWSIKCLIVSIGFKKVKIKKSVSVCHYRLPCFCSEGQNQCVQALRI